MDKQADQTPLIRTVVWRPAFLLRLRNNVEITSRAIFGKRTVIAYLRTQTWVRYHQTYELSALPLNDDYIFTIVSTRDNMFIPFPRDIFPLIIGLPVLFCLYVRYVVRLA